MSIIHTKETKNILILEDEPSALRYLIKIVEDCSPLEHQVFGYTNLREAYRCMDHYRIALFIVDIVLNGKVAEDRGGYEFIEEVRRSPEYRYVPVIFVTGLEEPRREAYRSLHCAGYIQKPYNVNEIHQLVRRCLTYKEVGARSKLHLKKDGIHILIDVDQIVYIRIIGKKLFIKCTGKPMMQYAYITMKEISNQLNCEPMIPCGKGLLVSGRYIDYVDQKERKLFFKDDTEPLKLTRAGIKEGIHSITDSVRQ